MSPRNDSRTLGYVGSALDPSVVAVRGVLTMLRTRAGLSSDQLRHSEIDAHALTVLSTVRRYAQMYATTPEDAARDVIQLATQQLAPTDRLIVDAELRLELFRADPPSGIDLDQLYSAQLATRRRYLMLHWQPLHEAIGCETVVSAPTARTLRGGAHEIQAFTALAQLLVSGMVPFGEGRATVTVVGDAAMDHVNIVEQIPQPGSSVWGDFQRHPGGKGLNRAVALSRLNLDARLIAAVGADSDGEMVVQYLSHEGVDTSLITTIEGARTPVATVLMTPHGEMAGVAYKQDRIRFQAADLESGAVTHAIRSSDAVVVTFEQPIEIAAHAIDIARSSDEPPWVILNPSPPAQLPRLLYERMQSVHYVVGTTDEIAGLWADSSADESAGRLVDLGVAAVCMIDRHGCTVRRSGHQQSVPQFSDTTAGYPGSSSAFTAALIYRLVTSERTVTDDDFAWAAAAMAAQRGAGPIAAGMPSVTEIEQLRTTRR
ncbi:carbohydrate kinase family protein [Nocardia huaxiensis]|uniref:carbohydrate kinase family protein n=1 Tax=Nocardia huaxiensis TaxID=2755382 RepID=UPI001E30D9DE|nr:PfkB family carbohydrate kinase [Nocardia huaxiensis]UFS98165.1 PfkB family carbohydrate kinase [Nocardia huaxiensis]